MIVFLSSDKGGTGRSVTGGNLAYRSALSGADVCYFDFDFGSPTAGVIYSLDEAARGIESRAGHGLHSYFKTDGGAEPAQLDVWRRSARESVRDRPTRAGRLVFVPGDAAGGEFEIAPRMVDRCVDLFLRAEEQFDLCLVDLSAGRSWATQMVLEATAKPALTNVSCRWLVFHRWTEQHILATNGLVYGERGLLAIGAAQRHEREQLENAIRFVRTAVPDPTLATLAPEQAAWLQEYDVHLHRMANQRHLGHEARIGSIPADPLLQWRENLITDEDVSTLRIANKPTMDAFTDLARAVTDNWEPW
ncbi:SCO2523 family variant P-loop protein [Cryptosporangium sp. NPDC051539]|uniref:SCO2523 family variant P-loop protein n=1 Tax=Cryptosporangium sp. NPDC051539 TaxID=3363962 RepID=UPI0037A4E4B1